MKQIFEGEDFEYNVFGPEILDAQKYGLPQMRKRVFVVGIKKDLGITQFAFPKPRKLSVFATSRDESGKLVYLNESADVPIEYYLPEKGYKWVTEIERSQNKARLNRNVIGCQTAVQQVNWSGDFRLEVAKPEHRAPGSGVFVTQYNGPLEHLRKEFAGKDVVVRKLMPDECMRLMGFKGFKVHPELIGDDKVLYRQAGNSIAVPVLRELFKEIQKQVFNKEGL